MKMKFSAELFEGHKQVTAVIVPFDPEIAWNQKPIALDPRREGWLVRGTVNKKKFEGWIGYRWSRFFIIIGPELREVAGVAVGDTLDLVVEPTTSKKALAIAQEQAKLTTAPSRKKKKKKKATSGRSPR